MDEFERERRGTADNGVRSQKAEDEAAILAQARDVAASIIADASNYPLSVVPHVISRDMSGLILAVAEAFIAAGYRKHPEPEWEYTTAGRDGSPSESRFRSWGSVDPRHAAFRRRKPGAWLPLKEGEK